MIAACEASFHNGAFRIDNFFYDIAVAARIAIALIQRHSTWRHASTFSRRGRLRDDNRPFRVGRRGATLRWRVEAPASLPDTVQIFF
jgi:hypothetical protein